jgi:hypothetical protein
VSGLGPEGCSEAYMQMACLCHVNQVPGAVRAGAAAQPVRAPAGVGAAPRHGQIRRRLPPGGACHAAHLCLRHHLSGVTTCNFSGARLSDNQSRVCCIWRSGNCREVAVFGCIAAGRLPALTILTMGIMFHIRVGGATATVAATV